MMTDENDIVIGQITEDETPTPTKPMRPTANVMPMNTNSVNEENTVRETAVSSSSTPPAVARRRGCVLLFFGAILGAILGTVLTLSILMGLNGSLMFTSTDAQLRRAINESSIEQEDTANALATRSANLDSLATRVGEVTLDLAEAREAASTAEAGMEEVQMAVTAVATQVTRLDKRVETAEGQLESAAESAAQFDAFLNGLKALLLGEATSPAPTATPEVKEGTPITKTPAAGSATATQTETGEATRTVRPTRTPRPTSTPLPLPTSTPEQRP